MQNKFQTFDTLKHHIALVENQYQTTLKRVQSDNGTEFINQTCQNYFQTKGIQHQKSCPYTPQQNGVVERKHKHLIQIARALLFQSYLPQKFWGEASLTATHLVNLLPTPVLQWRTPYEILNNRIPCYSHLRVFGCLCFATNTNPAKTKFAPRASKCIFLGYATGFKAYKVMDLESNKLFISRDVIFHETIFPSYAQNPASIAPLINIPTHESTPLTIPPPPATLSDNATTATTDPIASSSTASSSALSPTLPLGAFPPLLPTTRQSSRVHTKPIWLQDFVACARNTPSDASTQPTALSGSAAHTNVTPALITQHLNPVFHPEYIAYMSKLSTEKEPSSYKEAKNDPRWIAAMQQEIHALESNDTWDITDLPAGKRVIASKWVYRNKWLPNGDLDRHKARVVAKGYS